MVASARALSTSRARENENCLLLQAFRGSDGTQNRIQGTDAQWIVIGDGYSMMSWTFRFQDYVAANLVHELGAILAAKHISEIDSAKITMRRPKPRP
jgi:hypothetical protein